MDDEHNTRDDAERLADRIIAAFEDNGFELADGWIERARGDVVTILKGALDARDATLRDAREQSAAKDEVVAAARNAEKKGFITSEMHDALARLDAAHSKEGEHAQPEPARREDGE